MDFGIVSLTESSCDRNKMDGNKMKQVRKTLASMTTKNSLPRKCDPKLVKALLLSYDSPDLDIEK